MGLNSDKTSKVFLLFFYQILFYFCTTVTQSSRFYHNCGCFWSLHPKNQNFHCAVSSNDQYQENGFAADVLIGLKSRPNRSHRKRSYSISNIGNMMGCDHPSCKSVHWQASYGILNIFQQWPSSFWIFKILIFDHVTVIVVRICCCMPNFSVNDFAKNFRSQTPKMQFWAMNRTFKREWQKFKDL